ncbi:MAG: molybdate ABC transporter substrate-binding protein [Thermoleophilaceae bacterium]|nr:molybdate ABC transporter substrate-binding protein [Thermoleophilaceae bacterium]
MKCLVAAGLIAVSVAGCGTRVPTGADSARPQIKVAAAASLTEPFTGYGEQFEPADAAFSFGASDELAAQIRSGALPDVYAAANTTLPDELAKEGLVGEPVAFATNSLVVGVPADSGLESIEDLEQSGRSVVIGSETVPVGVYTRMVLERLPDEGEAILANVRSEEPDVKGVLGKLTQGAADAGFVYDSDVIATKGQLRAIELPSKLQPDVAYGIAVVEGTEFPEQGQEFIDGLLQGSGAEALAEAGFGPSPDE